MNISDASPSLLGQVWHHPVSLGFRSLFYLVTPWESTFKTEQEIPQYVNDAFSYFIILVLLEMLVMRLQDMKPGLRLNDAMSSVSAGLFSQLPLILTRSIEVQVYLYVYKHHRLVELPWDSAWVWVLAFLGVDLGYYWVHRMAHEVNFMWAAHQVHHSSEDYNLSTALRQSVLQRYNSWMFYVPLAFFLPPSHFMVHVQFNLLYQFWIHTEVVKSVGPLEWILNTPSHHRVHHGRNRYCIDKNYAGVLIIWDRMFGTFEAEDEEVVYGLVHPIASWDAIYIQLAHWKWILMQLKEKEGLMNKLSVLFKGPGWDVGKPRMGDPNDIPLLDIKKEKTSRYDKNIPAWFHVYTYTHFLLCIIAQQVITQIKQSLSPVFVVLFTLYLIWTLTNIGYLYEHKWYAPILELVRCTVYLLVDAYVCGSPGCSNLLFVPRTVFLLSASIWPVNYTKGLIPEMKKQV